MTAHNPPSCLDMRVIQEWKIQRLYTFNMLSSNLGRCVCICVCKICLSAPAVLLLHKVVTLLHLKHCAPICSHIPTDFVETILYIFMLYPNCKLRAARTIHLRLVHVQVERVLTLVQISWQGEASELNG